MSRALPGLAALVVLLIASPRDAHAQDAPIEDPCRGQPDTPTDPDKPRADLTPCELYRAEGPCHHLPWTPIDRDKPLPELSDCDLWRLGFEWEGFKPHPPSLAAGLIAAGPGLIFNGLGHQYQGNRWVGWRILSAEGFGLGLIALGFLGIGAAEGSSILDDLGVFSIHLGGFLISSGYVSDVIGSSKGSNDLLPEPSNTLKGYQPTLRFTTLVNPELACDPTAPCTFAELRFDANLGFFTLGLSTLQHITRKYAEYSLHVGLKLLEGLEPYSFFGVFFTLENASFDRRTFNVLASEDEQQTILRFETATTLSIDMGQLLESLENVVNVISLGFGFAGESGYRAAVPGDQTRGYFLAEQAIHINLLPQLQLRPFYRYVESDLVAPINAWLGAFGFGALWTPWPQLKLDAALTVGDGEQLSIGVGWDF